MRIDRNINSLTLRSSDEDDARLVVTHRNRGEPYRDGLLRGWLAREEKEAQDG